MNSAAISVLATALALGLMTPAEADEWQGAYLTFGLGAAQTDMHSEFYAGEFGAEDQDLGPYVALGYDWSFGDFSLGALVDLELINARDDFFLDGKGIVHESDWFATLRGRVGVPVTDQVRVFASAGVAAMGVRSISMSALPEVDGRIATGLATGIGLDYALSPGRHLTVEYLHANFGRESLYDGNVFADPDINALRLGYVIKF